MRLAVRRLELSMQDQVAFVLGVMRRNLASLYRHLVVRFPCERDILCAG